jgi:hypothetical protein
MRIGFFGLRRDILASVDSVRSVNSHFGHEVRLTSFAKLKALHRWIPKTVSTSETPKQTPRSQQFPQLISECSPENLGLYVSGSGVGTVLG